MKIKKMFLSLISLSTISLSILISSCNNKPTITPESEQEISRKQAEKFRDYNLERTKKIINSNDSVEIMQEIYRNVFNDYDIVLTEEILENGNFKYVAGYFYNKAIDSPLKTLYNEVYKPRDNPSINNETEPFYSIYSSILLNKYILFISKNQNQEIDKIFEDQLKYINSYLKKIIDQVKPNDQTQQDKINKMKEKVDEDFSKIKEIIKSEENLKKVFYFYNTNLFFSSNLNVKNKYNDEKKRKLKDSFIYAFIYSKQDITNLKKLLNTKGYYIETPEENNITEYISSASKPYSSDFSFEILTNLRTYKEFFNLDDNGAEELFNYLLSYDNKNFEYFNSFLKNVIDLKDQDPENDPILEQSKTNLRIYEYKIEVFNSDTSEYVEKDMGKVLKTISESLSLDEKTDTEKVTKRIFDKFKNGEEEYVEINILNTLIERLKKYFDDEISSTIKLEDSKYNVVNFVPVRPSFLVSFYTDLEVTKERKKEVQDLTILSLVSVLGTLNLEKGISIDASLASLLDLVIFLESYAVNFIVYTWRSSDDKPIDFSNYIRAFRRAKSIYHILFADIEKSINSVVSDLL